MRYFKLQNSTGEILDITTTEVLFHDISGLGFEENTDFRSVGPIWKLNSTEYNQTPVSGKMCFTENGATTPYEKYFNFKTFISKSPLVLIYCPHGLGTIPYYKRVRVKSLSKGEINEYGVLDVDIEFIPYTPWYIIDTQDNGEVSELNLPGWVWDIGNKWRDSEEDALPDVGDVTYPFNDFGDPIGYIIGNGSITVSIPSDAYLEEHGEGWLLVRGYNNNSYTINTVMPFTLSAQRGYYTLKLECTDSTYRTKLKYEGGTPISLIDGTEAPVMYNEGSCDVLMSGEDYTFTVTINPGETIDYYIRIKLTSLGYCLYRFGGEHSTTVEFNCPDPGLAKITLFGPATNPTWSHHVDGTLYASGGFDSSANVSLTEDEKLVIDNTDGSYSMKIVTISTGEERNVYSLRDFDKVCFFNLKEGTNTITAASANGSPLRIEAEGHILYATV